MTDLIKRKDVYEALEKYFKGGFGSIYDMVEEIPTVEVADRKTEPQYDIDKGTIKCDNCSENGSYKCSKCDGEMYFKRLEVEDEPQTCKTCKWGEWYRKGYDITMMDDECGGGVVRGIASGNQRTSHRPKGASDDRDI